MAKSIKVILIDPLEKTITKLSIESTLDAYYKLIDCEMIESVRPLSLQGGNSLYCDEEALLKDEEQPTFSIQGWGVIMGKAIVLRHNNEGETVSTTYTVKDIESLVSFE